MAGGIMFLFTATMQLHRGGANMKKIIALLLIAVSIATTAFAADWSQYESGRNNIRLDGYDSQPGYIKFTDGNGTTVGYVWLDRNRGLVWCSPEALTHTTTKLTNSLGVPVSSAYTYNGSN